jgi:hypothetical protein
MNGFFDPLPFGPGVYAPRATPQWQYMQQHTWSPTIPP